MSQILHRTCKYYSLFTSNFHLTGHPICRGTMRSCRCPSKVCPVQKRPKVQELIPQMQRRTSKAITETEDREAVIRDWKPRTPEKEPTGRRRRRVVLGPYLMEKAIILCWLLSDLLGQCVGRDTGRQASSRVVLLVVSSFRQRTQPVAANRRRKMLGILSSSKDNLA